MVSQMQLVAGMLFLAALVYFLYLWNRRKDQITCPSCGAKIDLYGDECPHCGHEKSVVGEPVAAAAPETMEPADSDESERNDVPANTEPVDDAVDYEAIVEGTISDVKDAVAEHDMDLNKLLAAEKANKDRVTLVDWINDQMA